MREREAAALPRTQACEEVWRAVQTLPGVAATSPDGRVVVAAQGLGIVAFDIQTGKVLFKSMVHDAPIQALAFSPDGKRLVSGGQGRMVILWDCQTGKPSRRLLVPAPVTGIRFTDDGRAIIIRESDQTVREVDADTGKVRRAIRELQKK